ncbi:MAG: VOC family protein [Phycisphaerales bacterium]|nr:MAG: VOC family protein [Phycisphaerales bacterium]
MKRRMVLITLGVGLTMGLLMARAAQTSNMEKAFSRSTIDIGVVVSDVEKAAKFYAEAVGFSEVQGFDVSGQLAGDSGLTDYHRFKVRVFVLGDEPAATRLKLMEIPDAAPKKTDQQYISSSLGYSYLTVLVTDTKAAVERAKAAGVSPVKAPYQLGGNNYLTLLKDPDGNIVELVGPMN